MKHISIKAFVAPLSASGALIALAASMGCTPNPGVWPKGPESTKTGYSVTYKLNGRTPLGEIEASGGIPMAGNETFRATSKAPKAEHAAE